MADVSRILSLVESGAASSDQLLPVVYDELRRLAASELAQRPGQTLQPTAHVHEAFLRLVAPDAKVSWQGRRHFFAAAAQAIRRILVDKARSKLAVRRGAGSRRVEYDEASIVARFSDQELIHVDDVLAGLERADAGAAELVRLHVFGGFSLGEAGEILGVSRATAYRDWAFARAWLRDALAADPDHPAENSRGP